MKEKHISVCICTYKRLALLRRLLEAVERQKTDGRFTFSIVVSDNDCARSAEQIVRSFAERSSVPTVYDCERERNIALARNTALRNAEGEYIAFIDDDEFPVAEWLAKMLQALDEHGASGVLGPVRPHFEQPPARWIVRGGFCERPEHPTGTAMKWNECRTGNVLFRRAILAGIEEPFDPKFGTGGEDVDFFLRMTQAGRNFIWCNEAIAYETVPPARLRRRYMLKRALLRGKNTLKRSAGCWRSIAISLTAVPIYLGILPVLAIAGHHHFMKFCIKLCDHAGRLLAFAGMNPIHERDL